MFSSLKSGCKGTTFQPIHKISSLNFKAITPKYNKMGLSNNGSVSMTHPGHSTIANVACSDSFHCFEAMGSPLATRIDAGIYPQ